MSDMIPLTLDDALDRIIEADEQCPIAAAAAYEARHDPRGVKIYTLSQIARYDGEPYAQQIAADWLKENNEA